MKVLWWNYHLRKRLFECLSKSMCFYGIFPKFRKPGTGCPGLVVPDWLSRTGCLWKSGDLGSGFHEEGVFLHVMKSIKIQR
jgi:hypothetical protein